MARAPLQLRCIRSGAVGGVQWEECIKWGVRFGGAMVDATQGRNKGEIRVHEGEIGGAIRARKVEQKGRNKRCKRVEQEVQ